MDKKTYLCRYHNLLEKIQKKKEYIAFCHERAGSIPGPQYGERINNPSPSYEAPFVRWIFKGIEAEEELEELEKKLKIVKMEIEKAINTGTPDGIRRGNHTTSLQDTCHRDSMPIGIVA